MKKILSMVLAIASIVCFSSCSEDDGEMNPYAGTKWSKSYHSSFSGEDYMYVIEFTDTDFSYYEADIYGGYKSGMTQGKYTYVGNRIMIDNVRMKTSIFLNEYIYGATVSGNVLTLNTYWVSKDGTRYDETMIMNKRN